MHPTIAIFLAVICIVVAAWLFYKKKMFRGFLFALLSMVLALWAVARVLLENAL